MCQQLQIVNRDYLTPVNHRMITALDCARVKVARVYQVYVNLELISAAGENYKHPQLIKEQEH